MIRVGVKLAKGGAVAISVNHQLDNTLSWDSRPLASESYWLVWEPHLN